LRAGDTREQFLDRAEALFAERGFYGVSIAAIARELGLTKQALLHHFGSKEKLYGAVLARISSAFDALGEEAARSSEDAARALRLYMLEMLALDSGAQQRTLLLVRELLDNRRRADTAGTWYLKPFLQRLIAMVQAVPNWSDASDAEALALVYQWLGAINYYVISEPTLKGIFGKRASAELQRAFPTQFETLIEASLHSRQALRVR
jgi:AcrR family transcriptional regulator